MSHQHYNNQWLLVQQTLTEVLEEDTPAKLVSLQNATPDAIFEHLSVRYLKYLDQFRRLEECYDQIVHPQKRRAIRVVLDGVLGRLVELKHELSNLESCDCQYLLNTALGMKLQLADLEIPIPRYFVRERRDQIADYNQVIVATEARRAEILTAAGGTPSSVALSSPPNPPPQPPITAVAVAANVNSDGSKLSTTPSSVGTPQTSASSTAAASTTPTTSATPASIGPPGLSSVERKEQTEEAVRMIQKFERVRQAKRFVRELELDKRQQRTQEKYMRGEKPTVKQRTQAAIVIQKWWRRFAATKQTARLREEEGQFLGMRGGDQRAGGDAHQFMKELESARHLLQEQHEKEFQEALVKIKERLRLTEGPEMKAYFEDLLRQWFIEARDLSGKFPDYPTAEEGGSLNIFKLIDPEQAQEELNAAMEQLKDNKGGKGKDGKGGKDGKKGGKGDEKGGKGKDDKKGKDAKDKNAKGGKDDKKKKGKEEDEGWLPLVPESPFIEQILQGSHDFLNLWFDRDERDNPRQNYDTELIKADKREEVKEEVRLVVDDEMRQELEYLKVAIDNMKIKKKKGKKGKGKKGKKGKKNKDITANRDPQSLFEELVLQNIIRRIEPNSRSLDDYIGAVNLQAQRIRDSDAEPRPGAGDVRQALSLYAALPLGAKPEVRANLPHIKGVLLGGLPSSGKRMLAEAVACQTGALFLDMTPSNIFGKYPGKSGMVMLMHLVFKVARLYQPAMIFIDEAEKLVAKKGLTKAEKAEMKLFKKELSKTLKKWPKEERVLVFGTTSSFNDCDPKGLSTIFTKIIPLYPPEYTSRYDLWTAGLSAELKRDVRSTNPILLSLLARLSDGYTSGQICTMARNVKPLFTDSALANVDSSQLTTLTKDDKAIEQQVSIWLEYLLARTTPVYKEQLQSFIDWVAKIPLVKKRQLMLDVLHGLVDPKKQGKKGGKDAKGADKKKK